MILLSNGGVNPWLSVSLVALGAMIVASFVIVFMVKNRKLREALIRAVLFVAGGLSLLLGIIGAFLPIMPTVPFVILTAMCWGRASPRFHYWLLQHRVFGPMIRDWLERRAIPRRAKYLAWSMMSLSCMGVTYKMWTQYPQYLWVAGVACAVCLSVGIWMSRQPDA